ncbi:E3 ubiquitin ligase BIG BROTHER-related-like [Malania oleifera]|uniref:E3 ubiquitin ligase BIG BROTHER-related-like n=1 Tax=Malania oleifera TaxID=397392 RepID=UPI0025ADAD17|nr:E3 ubiquitin ligase BIG BROTHER-related-like [Malania oleifera]
MNNEEEIVIRSSSLEQVNSDFALAMALQEQERTLGLLATIESEDEESETDTSSDNGDDYDDEFMLESGGVNQEHELDLTWREEVYDDDREGDEEQLPEVGFLCGEDEEEDTGEHELDLIRREEVYDGDHEGDEEQLPEVGILCGVDEEEDSSLDDDEEILEEDDIDPDELSYEELITLGDFIGQENRGLSQVEISTYLHPFSCKFIVSKIEIDRCVICQVEYEEGEGLVALSCDHPYHLDCISGWLQIKKTCPICGNEVSPLLTNVGSS